jgi:hypothetical protein
MMTGRLLLSAPVKTGMVDASNNMKFNRFDCGTKEQQEGI